MCVCVCVCVSAVFSSQPPTKNEVDGGGIELDEGIELNGGASDVRD